MDVSPSTNSDRGSMSSSRYEQDYTLDELEKALSKDNASRVAIFRDREKDLSDPDYDRSYQKYVRGLTPCHNFGLQTCNIHCPPFLQYEPDISSFNHLPRN
ncbi:R3H domain-containing protein 2-like [Canna indica]|uniref:R3H domain-containing protein 2-like n=1 Tax=Canna indica TaxID=4628 RepID=A0AAQ3QJM9_9LILI|nr:R3H domain-containing protein 2-like [Canna indica]